MQYVHLVMEKSQGGDLFSRAKKKGIFTEQEAAVILKKVASVLSCAHSRGILHRDIKPENILMACNESDVDIYVADWGSAAHFGPGQKLNQLVGSPLYIAPSVLCHEYGTEADLWSLGVVLYVLLTGVPPFWGTNNAEIFHSVMHEELNLEKGRIRHVSDDCKDLLYHLLNRKVDETLSATQVLSELLLYHYCHEALFFAYKVHLNTLQVTPGY